MLCRILKITFGMQVRSVNSSFSAQITFENLLLGVYVSGQHQKLFNCQVTCQHFPQQSLRESRFSLLCCPLVGSWRILAHISIYLFQSIISNEKRGTRLKGLVCVGGAVGGDRERR